MYRVRITDFFISSGAVRRLQAGETEEHPGRGFTGIPSEDGMTLRPNQPQGHWLRLRMSRLGIVQASLELSSRCSIRCLLAADKILSMWISA